MKRKVITQIGSLPHKDEKEAVSYSLKHDIPFLPELPQLRQGDSMLEYIKNPGQLSSLAEFKKHSFKTVKIQCVGPATLLMLGYEPDDAVTRINEHIGAILDGLKAERVILFLDEPALGEAGFDFEDFWEPIFSTFDVVRGIHCCGNMDWDKLFKSDLIEIISFDASQFDITRYPGYRGKKRIAWGVKAEDDVKDFQEGDLLTLPCGMGTKLHKVENCQKELDKLIKIFQQIKKRE